MYYFFLKHTKYLKKCHNESKCDPNVLENIFCANLTFDMSKSPLRNCLSFKFFQIYKKITVYQSHYHFVSFNSRTQALKLNVFFWLYKAHEYLMRRALRQFMIGCILWRLGLLWESTDVTYQCQNVCSDLFF